MPTETERPPVAPDSDRSTMLIRLAESLADRHPVLPEAHVLRWHDDPVVMHEDDGRMWLACPSERDPLLGGSGPRVIPSDQLRLLRQVATKGPRFDAILIAHELDPDGPAGLVRSQLLDGPRTCDDDIARVLLGPAPAHPGVVRAAGLLDTAAQFLTARIPAGVAVQIADRLLDPMVIGIVAPPKPRNGALCLGYVLTAWRW